MTYLYFIPTQKSESWVRSNMQMRFLTPLPKAHLRVTIASRSKASKNDALGVGKVSHSSGSLRSARFCCAPLHCAALHSIPLRSCLGRKYSLTWAKSLLTTQDGNKILPFKLPFWLRLCHFIWFYAISTLVLLFQYVFLLFWLFLHFSWFR